MSFLLDIEGLPLLPIFYILLGVNMMSLSHHYLSIYSITVFYANICIAKKSHCLHSVVTDSHL